MARKTLGLIILLSLGWLVFAGIATIRYAYRERSGVGEAERGLAVVLDRVETSFAKTGRLCGSSKLMLSHGWGGREYLGKREQDGIDAERDANVGFACLGLDGKEAEMRFGRDMYSFESDGTSFRARAFRAYLYDPQGVLPRYEVHGEIVGGKLHVDHRVRRIDAGGPDFLGHPPASYAY